MTTMQCFLYIPWTMWQQQKMLLNLYYLCQQGGDYVIILSFCKQDN